MQTDEAESISGPDRPGADVIALPQLERLPSENDDSTAGFRGLDSRSSRLEALELVRAAVELADRIERDAQDTAKDRLARIEEEVRLRRTSLDEREVELERGRRELEAARQEHERNRQDLEARRQELDAKQRELEHHRQQVNEAGQALQAQARREADETLAAATAEARALVEQARRDAAEVADSARSAAAAVADSARDEAAELTAAARTEAEQLTTAARSEADQLTQTARVEAEQRAGSPAGGAEDGRHPEATVPSAVEPEPVAAAVEPEESAGQADPGAFTPPPLSVEDLATVSSLPRLGIRNRLRGR